MPTKTPSITFMFLFFAYKLYFKCIASAKDHFLTANKRFYSFIFQVQSPHKCVRFRTIFVFVCCYLLYLLKNTKNRNFHCMFRGVCRFLTLGLSQHRCEGNFCAQYFFCSAFWQKMFSMIAWYFINKYLSIYPKCYDRLKITIHKNVPTQIYIWFTSSISSILQLLQQTSSI